ncbi:hypothetical protein [Streptomyces sp. R44]|uniref:Uncharacterized protein n=1 Tax=Streptomyces sp. R44 TaxID=3238633 RepID=A0AB39T546_9ACTN
MDDVEWAPLPTRYAVDSHGRIGCIRERYAGVVYLRPPGGGREWTVPSQFLRQPTEEEMAQVRALVTPAPAVEA